MAVAVRPVRTVHFVRLKLRIMGNGLRGQSWRVALFVAGAGFGLLGAVAGFLLLTGTAAVEEHRIGLIVAAFAGTAITLGWLLMPLLFFGIDETIDPARFALLPIPRRALLRGMLAAALVGIPAVATAVALTGLVVGGALRGGVGAALVGLVGGGLALLTCVVGSRALTSAFASMLRSRRVRDLAAIAMAVLASSIAPIQLAVTALVRSGDPARAGRIADVLAWTPLAAPFTAHIDVADGRWPTALAKLAIGAGSLALLTFWWSATLEAAMVGAASGGRAGAASSSERPVTSLYPRVLRGLRANRGTALVAREWRYWWRDPRRRSGLISLTIAGVVLPIALSATGGGTPLPLAVAFSAVLSAMVLANQFGSDGTAYALHVIIGIPGRVELRARSIGLAMLMAPILLAAVVIVGFVLGSAEQLPAALGTVAAGLGVSAGAAALVSVLVPYAFPESTNPFAVSGNTGDCGPCSPWSVRSARWR